MIKEEKFDEKNYAVSLAGFLIITLLLLTRNEVDTMSEVYQPPFHNGMTCLRGCR